MYSQLLYSLAQAPSGSLMSFNNKVNNLIAEFTKIMSKLKIYMPSLADKKSPQAKISLKTIIKSKITQNQYSS